MTIIGLFVCWWNDCVHQMPIVGYVFLVRMWGEHRKSKQTQQNRRKTTQHENNRFRDDVSAQADHKVGYEKLHHKCETA